MPINIPTGLPAADVLTSEHVFVMTQDRAIHQDIRPLELLFLNLMPHKIASEIQYMRKLSSTPIQVNIDLLRVDHHISKHTPQVHLDTFYKDFDEVKDRNYDGMIITGAPLEHIVFDDVTFWPQLTEILNWTQTHVTSTLYSCWGVAAALKHFYGLPMISRKEKLSGVYLHQCSNIIHPLIRGFDEEFLAPQSRYMDFPVEVLSQETDLEILASSEEVGVFLACTKDFSKVLITGHPEYDADTLSKEYFRDLEANLNPIIPKNYFPHNDPSLEPKMSWRAHAALLFSNWVNTLYQVTPYDFVKTN